jgi:hypothetical protein
MKHIQGTKQFSLMMSNDIGEKFPELQDLGSVQWGECRCCHALRPLQEVPLLSHLLRLPIGRSLLISPINAQELDVAS